MRPTAGSKAELGPPCTDNFQTAAYVVDHAEYQSVEQGYQALKFASNTVQEKIRGLTKKPRENDSAFGVRCWQAAHSSGSAKMRRDHDAVKVDIMYRLMRAKYEQHPEMVQELLTTGDAVIEGGPSTEWTSKRTRKRHRWADWNGWIQMRLREEFRSPGSALHQELEARFAEYMAEEGGPHPRLNLPGEGAGGPASAAEDEEKEVAGEEAVAGEAPELSEEEALLAQLQLQVSEAALRCRDLAALQAALQALQAPGTGPVA